MQLCNPRTVGKPMSRSFSFFHLLRFLTKKMLRSGVTISVLAFYSWRLGIQSHAHARFQYSKTGLVLLKAMPSSADISSPMYACITGTIIPKAFTVVLEPVDPKRLS